MAEIHQILAGHRPGLWPAALSPRMLAQVVGFSEPRWSPNGRQISYLRSFNGRGRILVVPLEGGIDLQITSDPPAQPGGSYSGGFYDWSPDGQSVVYAAPGGKLWIIPSAGGRGRRLAEGEGRQRAPAWSPDGQSIAYVSETETRSAIAVAAAKDTAWPRRLDAGADFTYDPAWSADGQWLAWQEWNVPFMPWDCSRIVIANLATGATRVVAGGNVGGHEVAATQPRFAPVGHHLAFLSDQGGFLNLWLDDGKTARPLVQEGFEHGPPSWSPGARTYAWSPDGTQIAFLRNDNGNWRLFTVDVASGQVRPLETTDGVRSGLSWSVKNEIGFVYSSATLPPVVKAVNVDSGSVRTFASAAVGGIVEAGLTAPEPVHWTSRDGATLYGHVYRPARAAEQPYPLLVLLHGGPTGQFGTGWNGQIQYFVQRGWMVFTPEYRGSTGYGRSYTQALREHWGIHDVNDTLDGIEHVAATGPVDRERVVVMGGSAGGYTVLMIMAQAGDRIRAGVDLYGVADLWELNEGTHRLEAHYNHRLIGALPEHARRYAERSPTSLAHQIKGPLLVLQGEIDPVVPKSQSDALVEGIRRGGGTVEYHVYPGEGHGWSRLDTIIDALERIDRFLVNNVLLR